MFWKSWCRSIISSLVMFFAIEVLNVYWQTTRLTLGDIDRAIKVSGEYSEYSNLNTVPYILLIAGFILVVLSIIFERNKAIY